MRDRGRRRNGGAELRAIERLFAAADRRFSRFQPGSELCAVNAAAGR